MQNKDYPVWPQEVLDKKARVFEIFNGDSCWRCGGTGRYSWNRADRDLCYGCGGSGHNMNTVGHHAYSAYRADRITEVKASELRRGQVIEWDELMIEACTSRTVLSRIVSKRTDKKSGFTTLKFHNREESHAWGSDMKMRLVNEEVRMINYRSTGNEMDNIIQVSLQETREIEFDESDIVLFTASKVPHNLPHQWFIADALMPSKKALDIYFKHGWKGKENQNYQDDWFDKYTVVYKEDINNDRSKKWLEQIVKRAMEGRKVYLVCYCQNKSRCHTSLIKTACYDIMQANKK